MKEVSLVEFLKEIPDPRVDRTKRHPLVNIIVMVIVAVIGGANTWEEIVAFCKLREAWLEPLLDLRRGIPSASTFKRVFRALQPDAFARAFGQWVQTVVGQDLQGKLVAIDGKTLRGSSKKKGKQHPLHLVTAWVAENHVVFGQVATAAKSNEITAIPELLKMLVLKGATVTIDAMGCQRSIAKQIIDAGADYVLALKGNQSSLHTEVQDAFATRWINDEPMEPSQQYQEVDDGHGRQITRTVLALETSGWLSDKQDWPRLRSIVQVHSVRRQGQTTTEEYRYYLSSHRPDARLLARQIRRHSSTENEQHWVLDVAFREDESRIRTGHGPDNFAAVRRLALSLLKNDNTTNLSLKAKRKLAGWDTNYLAKVIACALPLATSNQAVSTVG